jgi:hypothetical protein
LGAIGLIGAEKDVVSSIGQVAKAYVLGLLGLSDPVIVV